MRVLRLEAAEKVQTLTGYRGPQWLNDVCLGKSNVNLTMRFSEKKTEMMTTTMEVVNNYV